MSQQSALPTNHCLICTFHCESRANGASERRISQEAVDERQRDRDRFPERQDRPSRPAERCADGKPANEIKYWREFFEKVAASEFLCGAAGGFAADLEWLIRPENFLKTIEGRYDKRGNGKTTGHHSHAS